MNIRIKRLFSQDGREIGCVLTAVLGRGCTPQEKQQTEARMEQYARNVLYPNQGLHVYSETHQDLPSIVVIRDINNLPEESVNI